MTETTLAAGGQPSAVAWGAVWAGAAAAAALSLILLVLGTGLGLSAVSPWSNQGPGAPAMAVWTILWVTLTQVLAAGLGGYLAGRLRTKWTSTHPDEVYFRDTAHGFLAWSVATLVTAGVLGSVTGSIAGNGLQAGAGVASAVGGAASPIQGVATPGTTDLGKAYFVDTLFRRAIDMPSATTDGAPGAATASATPLTTPATEGEMGRILMNGVATGTLPADDARYAAQLVSQSTGLAPQDAEKRVATVFGRMQTTLRDAQTSAKEAADKARKAAASTALWLFISLLIGAFTASWCATFGGRRRDL